MPFFARAGNSLKDAEEIRLKGRTETRSGRISNNDPTDVYRVRLSRSSNLQIVVSDIGDDTDDLKLELLGADGGLIKQSNFVFDSSEIIDSSTGIQVSLDQNGEPILRPRRVTPYYDFALRQRNENGDIVFTLLNDPPLKAGNYFIRVSRVAGETNYDLEVTAEVDRRIPRPRSQPQFISSDKLQDAKGINVNNRTRTFSGDLDGGNPEDLYRFRVTRNRNLSVLLADLDADANLELADRTGRIIAKSERRGDASENIDYSQTADRPNRFLKPGTYYLRVYRKSGSTDYDLTATTFGNPQVDGVDNPNPGNGAGNEAGSVAQLVSNILSGTTGSDPSELVAFNNSLYFVADDGVDGRELWVSDGTAGTTRQVFDLNPGASSSNPTDIAVFDGALYFAADDGSGNGIELFRSDGDVGSAPERLANINPGSPSSNPRDLVATSTFLYFSADGGVNGRELWRSDGTAAGTNQVTDLNPGASGSNPEDLAVVNNVVYFAADDGSGDGVELFRSDGTIGGTDQVADINVGNPSSNPRDLVVLGDVLYFSAIDAIDGRELWRSSGTLAGTNQVADINPGATSGVSTSDDPLNLIIGAVGDRVFFAAQDLTGDGVEVWQSDGTLAGTQLVEDVNPGTPSSSPRSFVDANGVAYFTASDGVNGRQIWQSDGTSANTELVTVGAINTFNPDNLVVVGNFIYFTATTTATGEELWRIPL